MAKAANADPRRLYSWWWDSHISPKNSKWLQENLRDLDVKVSLMIRLLEADGDSFARKAEMYYKKRPELMKLVEEFYRAYRALAERYDHATGALRQAHRTIQEAFPNQIASLPSDEFPGLSEPHTPEMLPQTRLSFEAIDLPKEAFDAIKRGEENDGAAGRRGIKQLNEIFAPGKARKGLNFLEDEGKGRNGSDFFDEEELPRLRESLSKSESARDAALLECSKLSEKISSLEMDISRVCEENEKSSKERFLLFETQKMALEERVNALTQQMNDRWQDLEKVNGHNADLSQELRSKQEELDKLVSSVKEECLLRVKAEEALETSEKMNLSYQEEIKILFSDLQSKAEMLSDVEGRSRYLEEEGEKIKEENESLNTQILSSASIMKNLRDEIAALEEACVRLEDEARERANEKNVLQQKIDVLQDEVSDLDLKLRCVLDQIEAVGLSEESFQVSVSEMQRKNRDLMERCDKFEDERVLLVRQLEEVTEKNALLEESLSLTTDELEGLTAKMTSTEDEKAALLGNIERETEKGLLLEKSLSNTSAELEREREKTTSFEESCASLTQRIQELGAENDGLSQQLEATARSLENISNNNTLLENLLSNASGEIGGLREKVQSMNSEMEELQVSFKDKEAVLVGQLEGAAAKNTVLEKSLVESTAELEGLKSKERSLEESCASFNRRVTELMAENGILAHQMEKFTEDNISLENSLTEANGLIRELRETIQGLIQTHEGEKAALVGQSEREREKSAVLERSLSETRSELDVERERARALENSCESLNRRTQELAQENNSISQEMKSSLSNANGEIEGLREKLQSMNSELGRLQETFKDKEAILIVQRDEGAEKSMILEESLSRTTAELEGLKLKERSLEDCCDSLNRRIAEIAANNSSLVHQLEELSEKNVTLDSSLSDARSESEGLREKLKILDESMKSLWEENSSLLSEKASLTSQVENVSSSVDKVTKRHADLEEKHLNLERERENTLSLVDELRSLLNLSQQGCRHKDEELERLNEELLDLQIRSFIYENHLIHADECFWKLLKSFSLMREENLSQKKAIESASEHKKNLHNGIDMVLEILGIEHASEEAESRFQNIIIKIKEIEKALSDAVDDNSLLILRESVLSVFLQQLGLDLMHLNSENSSKGKQLLGLMRERQELLLSNEELTEAVHVGQRRESLLMDELSDLRSDIKNLEEENSSTLLETLSLSSLSLLFERLAAEREMNLTALEAKMTELTEKSAILKTQNSFLGDSITLLNQQVEIGKNSLSQKDSELAEAIQKVNALEDAQLKLCADFDAIRVRLNDSIRMIEELEGKICEMTEEIRSYEEEVSKLWADSHISAVYAQIYKEKMLELIGECASLEEKVIVAQTDSDSLEREHRTLKETLIAYLPLVLTLQESLRNLEIEILTLIKHHGLKSGSEQEISATISDPREIDHPSEQIHSIDDPYGFMGLEKLQFRIASLQELIKLSASSTSKTKNEEETHKSLQDSTNSNRILETDDQMLRLWEAAERDNSILLSLKGEEQSKNPSSKAKREKEGVDQMGLSRKVNSRRDWSKRISDRLAADAQRLLALEKSTAELKTQLEKSGASSRKSTEMKYEAMRGRVKKVEEAVSELVNSNAVSARRAEGSVDQKKQVVEEVQSESEKIGRLELELQKIQYIILKINEERKTGARGGGRQSRTVLRDYFYGRGEGDGHKRGWLCGSCVHSSTVSK